MTIEASLILLLLALFTFISLNPIIVTMTDLASGECHQSIKSNNTLDVVIPSNQIESNKEEDNSMQPGVKKVELIKKVWTKFDIWIICIG